MNLLTPGSIIIVGNEKQEQHIVISDTQTEPLGVEVSNQVAGQLVLDIDNDKKLTFVSDLQSKFATNTESVQANDSFLPLARKISYAIGGLVAVTIPTALMLDDYHKHGSIDTTTAIATPVAGAVVLFGFLGIEKFLHKSVNEQNKQLLQQNLGYQATLSALQDNR